MRLTVRRLPCPQSFVSKRDGRERRVDAVGLQEFADLYGGPLDFFMRQTRDAAVFGLLR